MSIGINEVKTKNRKTVLIAGVIIQLCAGILYMWSVFKPAVKDYLSWDNGSAAMVTSIMMIGFVLGVLVGGKALDVYGARKAAVTGSILMAVGIFSTAFVTPGFPWMVYITYALIGGFGVGMVYSSTVSNVQKWYFDKRGFATGVMVGAFGFSMVIFAPIASYLLTAIGVPGTFMALGTGFLIVCVLSSLMLSNPPEGYTVKKDGAQVNVGKSQKQYTTREMLGTKSFYLIFLSLFFILPAFFMLNPLLMTLGLERGLTKEMALFGVMLVGIFSALGRLSIAWVSDKIGRLGSIVLILAMTAVGVIAMIFAEGVLFLVSLSMIAMAFGGAAGVYPTLTADHFGTKNLGVNYGLVTLSLGASSLIFTMVNNALSGNGDYTLSFIIAAATCAISFVLILLLRREKPVTQTV